MEVHPILGCQDSPQPGLWYIISSYGQYPSMRVGHTITYVPGRDGKPDKLVIIGGANPSGPFAETHILYLDKYEWDELESDGLIGRYEHCAFLPETQPDNIYIFGGADQSKNLNDMQMLNLATEKWSSVSVSGTPPSPRTCRNCAYMGNKLYVFGGGGERSEPVNDRTLHVFDTESLIWSQPQVKGKVPKPRLGHVMVALGNRIYLHGGMARDIFYNELYELNIDTMTWKLLRCKGDIPQGCTAHAAVAISNTQFCIQGGMTPSGALDSTYVFNTVNSRWQKVKFDGPPPACRLDHAICLGYLTHPKSNPESSSKPEVTAKETVSSDKNGNATEAENGGRKERQDADAMSDGTERTHSNSEPQADPDRTPDIPTNAPSNVENLSIDTETNSKGSEGNKEPIQTGPNCGSNPTNNEQQVDGKHSQGVCHKTEDSSDALAETAEALANTPTIEGAKQVQPSTQASAAGDPTADALTSLLSIEGAKQVLSGRHRASELTAGVGSGSAKSLVCVIHGGMDTGGEIFDDCLVWRVDALI